MVRRLLVATAILGAVVGINAAYAAIPFASAQQAGGAQLVQDEELVDHGAALFGTHCALCHGEAGRGSFGDGPQQGPRLVGVGPAAVDFMLRTGRMPMDSALDRMERSRPRFDDEERRALVAYVASLAPGEGPDLPDVEGWEHAERSRGLELFTANCAACHGPTAQGIAVGQRDVSSRLDVVSPLEIAQAVRSGPGVMPRFSEETMDQADLLAVTRWVMDLRERESPGGWSFGRSGPVAEGFLAFVIGIGLLLIVMYLLGESAGDVEPDPLEKDDDGGA